MKKEVSVDEVVVKLDGGGFYNISGDLINGGSRNEQGDWVPFIHPHDITRRVNWIDKAKERLYCECGREFIINDNLKLIKCDY